MVYVVFVKTKRYPTDLTDSQWFIVQHLIPAAKPGGRPRSLDMRLVVDAILYLTVGGIQWRMLPSDFPPLQSVYTYFRQWRDDGSWRRLHDTLECGSVNESGDTSIQRLAVSIVRQSRPAIHRPVCEATMGANASQDENGIFSSIQWDSYWPSWSALLTCLTATGHGNCSDEAAVSVRNCVSSGLTAPIAAHCRDGLRSVFASALNQSSGRKNRKVSPYCPVVGLWNVPLLGSASIVALAKTMNDCRRVVSPLSISL